MSNTCQNCQYFRDLTSMRLGLRCMNNRNSPSVGDFLIIQSLNHSCQHYKDSKALQFEWDQNKNNTNKEKHQIGFERAHEIFNDPNHFQMVSKSDKWEKINPDRFDALGIDRNEGNLDPVRGEIIGKIGDKLYIMVYTFRGEIGDMNYRVISLRRADKNEESTYEAFCKNED